MTDWYGGLSGGQIHVQAYEASYDINSNTSQVQINVWIERTSGTGKYSAYTNNSWIDYVDGVGFQSGSGTYDLRGGGSQLLLSGSKTVVHNADGTRSVPISGSFSDPHGNLGSASAGGTLTLTTIPRATQPTVTPTSGNTDSTYAIGLAAASSAFYHDVAYSLDGGTTYTNIQTGIPGTTTSVNWTPVSTLLPNATGVTALIRAITYSSSGGTNIGSKTVSLPLTVPTSIVPTVVSVAWADSQTSAPDIPTMMGGTGRYVQGWSKLKPTVTAAGASGSTVVDVEVTQNGQTTPSGTAFNGPVTLSGSVPFSAIATDSRGRNSVPYTDTVTVTAYNFPNLPTPLVQRTSDAAGTTPSPTGTYLSITPSASVSDLTFGGVQKNLLEYQIRIAPKSTGIYTTVASWGSSGVSGNTWTTKRVFGTYASNTEWLVEVSIRDVFGKNGYTVESTVKSLTVPVSSEAVFMDRNEGRGLGLGKYHSQGFLDILGDEYLDGDLHATGELLATDVTSTNKMTQDGGHVVLDDRSSWGTDAIYHGTVSSTWTAGAPSVLLSDGVTNVTALLPANDRDIQPGSTVTLQKVGASWVITGAYTTSPAFMKQVPVSLQNGWILYSDAVSADLYGFYGDAGTPGDASINSTSATAGKIYVTKTSTGIVSVSGLVRRSAAPSLGTTIATLPVGFRPRQTAYFSVYAGAGVGNVAVLPTGDIIFLSAASGNVGFFSLDNIRFREIGASYTFVPLTLSTNWAVSTAAVFTGDTSGTGSHTPGYTMDEEGVVIFEGVAQATAAQSATAAISTVSGLAPLMTVHELVYGPSAGYNYVRYGAASGSGSGNVLNLGLAIASASIITLSQIILVMPSSQSGVTQPLTWYDTTFSNSWVAYNTSTFAKPAFTKTRDGLVLSGGLWASGTTAPMAAVPTGWKPRYQSLRGSISNAAIGRLDVGPPASNGTVASGSIVPTIGSSTWYSLDGQSWPAYR